MKIRNLLVVFLFLLAMVPATIFAQVDNWDGTAVQWTHGTGTQADPYLIESAENLAWISEMVNNGVTTYEGVYFRMTTDLDMQNIEWVPIGNSETNSFRGKFDGDNHFIDNISITGSYDYSGLFGRTSTGFSCANLGVKTNISSTRSNCGGIAGEAYGVMENCYNTGNIFTTAAYAGGIVGHLWIGRIEHCHNAGSVSSRQFAGGIAGTSQSSNNIVKNCYNTGSVSSQVSSAGGIAASYVGGSIESCYNTGSVSVECTTSNVSYSGGIIGEQGSSSSGCRIENCYNTGSVSTFVDYTSSHSTSCSGGIVGKSDSPTLILTKCYNKGAVSATIHSNSFEAYAGGLVGNGSTITIAYSYNRGDVSAYAHNNNMSGTRQAGGLVSQIGSSSSSITNSYNTGSLTGGTMGGVRGNTTGTVTNCYYLETCGGTVAGGTSKTEAAMKSASFPIILNVDSTIFVMDITPNVNDGYPIFGSSICEVTTNAATNINFTSAILNGYYTPHQYWSGGDADVIGFEYKPSTAANYTTVYSNIDTAASYNLTGLQSGITYNYRMFVQKDGLTYYGNEVSFTTLACDLQASVVSSVSEMCNGNSATLTASCSSEHSNLFTYRWNNNVMGNTLQVNDGETYTVTIQDTNGCAATASAAVTVNPMPTGTISGNTSLCAGESSVLTASGANSYTWNTGASTPTLTVNESGTYTCTFRNRIVLVTSFRNH